MIRRRGTGESGNPTRFTQRMRPEPEASLLPSDPDSHIFQRFGRTVYQSLSDVVEFSGWGEDLVAKGREKYDTDYMTRLAAEAIVHRVGEAIARVTQVMLQKFPETILAEEFPGVHLIDLKDFRNVSAHQYDRIDADRLWLALSVEVPTEAAKIAELLESKP